MVLAEALDGGGRGQVLAEALEGDGELELAAAWTEEEEGCRRTVRTGLGGRSDRRRKDVLDLRMGREDDPVDSMEIDGQQQLQIEGPAAVPEGFNSDYLRVYYGKLFPYGDFFKWLCYGNDGKHPGCDQSYVGRREFSFTLENDIYLRFQSFDSAAELESSIKEKCPFKIDIGPVYSVDPAKRHAYAQSGNNVFVPVERELIFDIDISDYDDVRYCCSGADVCLDCWPLMTIAMKILDTSLRGTPFYYAIIMILVSITYFGYTVAVVVSIAGSVIAEQESSATNKGLRLLTTFESTRRSYTDVLESFFEDKLLLTQQLFASEERCQKILDLIPDENVASELHDKWQGNRRSSISKEDVNAARWKQLKTTLQSGKHKALRRCVEEIIFSYTYPRLDMEVSKHMNHLLKAPFCIHPKTGRVCVPIDPNNCDDFDPTAVPTLSQLLGELNAAGFQADSENNWERTSLEKSIRFFRTSFLQPLLKACKEELESAYNAKLQQSKNSLNW
ncbi:DNA primase small subunit [Dichanthelium oligosanthes]|uniref:DNA primase n=1 Tax=Dichanthelium oligosanthes TaxID=888268 RepID=A0A1E5V0T7_9POAL|nr:DNA primase small subunit [Dichanthelium oligosanthes]